MKLRLNLKLLGGLALGVVLLAAGLYALHRVQVKHRASRCSRRPGRPSRTAVSRRRPTSWGADLVFAPKDTSAVGQYGLLLDRIAKTPQEHLRAFFVIEQALQRDPRQAEWRRKAAQIAMDFRRFEDARAHLETLLSDSPDDGEIELMLGRCDEETKQYKDAEARYEQAVQHAPHQIEGYVRLAELHRRELRKPKEADETIDAMVTANDKSARAHVKRARYRQRFGLPDAGDLAKARNLAPDDADVLLSDAETARLKGDFVRALAGLERGVQLYPKDARMYESITRVELLSQESKKAEDYLTRGVEELPDNMMLRWLLADLEIGMGKLEDAAKTIEEMRKANAAEPPVQFLEARMLAARQKWGEAARLLEQACPKLSPQPDLGKQAYLLLGQCYGQLSDPNSQYGAFREAAALDPKWVTGQINLAASLATLGKSDEAIAKYRLVLPEAPGVGVPLARLLLTQNMQRPEKERSWDEIEKALDGAKKAYGDAFEWLGTRAELLAARGDVEGARRLLLAARDKNPRQLEVWTALIALADSQKKPEEVTKLLDEATGKLGDRVELRLLRASLAARRTGPEAVKAIAALERDADKFPDAARKRLLSGLAAAYERAGDSGQYQRVLKEIVKQFPDDLNSRILLLTLALRASDDAAMSEGIEGLKKIEGEDGVNWRYAEAPSSSCGRAAATPRSSKTPGRYPEEHRLPAGGLVAVRTDPGGGRRTDRETGGGDPALPAGHRTG